MHEAEFCKMTDISHSTCCSKVAFPKLWFIRQTRRVNILLQELCELLPSLKDVLSYNSMQESLSWKAYSYLSSQEIPWLLWNPNVHYYIHASLPMVQIMSHTNPVYSPYSTSSIYILIVFSNLHLGLPSILSFRVFWPKFCMNFSYTDHIHIISISIHDNACC
jgi:hypothetical protein